MTAWDWHQHMVPFAIHNHLNADSVVLASWQVTKAPLNAVSPYKPVLDSPVSEGLQQLVAKATELTLAAHLSSSPMTQALL